MMQTQTLRLGLLGCLGFMTYLFQANILAADRIANLPLSIETIGIEWFSIQIILLIMSILVVLWMSVVNKMRRRELMDIV